MAPSGSPRSAVIAATAAPAEPRAGQSASIAAACRSNSGGSSFHPGTGATPASPLLAFLPTSVTATRGAWQTAVDPYTGRGGPGSGGRGGTAPVPTPAPLPR